MKVEVLTKPVFQPIVINLQITIQTNTEYHDLLDSIQDISNDYHGEAVDILEQIKESIRK